MEVLTVFIYTSMQRATSSWAQLRKTVHTVRLGLDFLFLCFLVCMIYLCVCFVLPLTVESFPFMF